MPTDKRMQPPLRMSSTLAIHERVEGLRREGRRVFHLGFGEARFPIHPRLLAALRDHAEDGAYAPVAGLPELRQRVAAYYRRFGIETDASRVLIGSGSKSLLFAAMAALRGDLVLPRPCWVSYEDQARLARKRVTAVATRPEDGYLLTPRGLRAGLKRTRAAGGRPGILLLNSPCNPTGAVYPDELLAELAAVAREEGLRVVSDEIYALCVHGSAGHGSIARHYPEATIVTGGLSKHLSLGGWRLGVAVLPAGELGRLLAEHMTAVAGSVWTSASTPVQHAAAVAYGGEPEVEAYIEACAAVQGGLTEYLHRQLEAVGVPCPRPAGGFYVFPGFTPWRRPLARRHGVRTSAELAELLLERQSIAALPGSEFGAAPGELNLRLSTSCLHGLAGRSAAEVVALAGERLPPARLAARAAPEVVEVAALLGEFVGSLGSLRPTPVAGAA